MAVAQFGTVVIETDVDRAVISTLRLWLPTYLNWMRTSRNLDFRLQYPRPESYQSVLEDDEFPEATLPSIIVTTAQPEGDATKYVDDSYSAAWRVAATAVVRGPTPTLAREYASLFGGAVKRCLRDQGIPDLGSLVWRNSNVAPVSDESGENRYLAAGINVFTASVDEVMTGEGPIGPTEIYEPPDPTDPEQAYDPLATVGRVTFDVTPKPIVED
jgi:hypothetical protein